MNHVTAMPGRRRAPAYTLLLAALGVSLGLLMITPGQATPAIEPATSKAAPSAKYVGRWNYDHPDRDTMTNIAVSDLPGRHQVPQVGDIVLTADGADRVIGRTNVGCTWRFRATPTSLKLDPAHQLCHNPTSNVRYTIADWTVTVHGRHATETLSATSHHERDYTFEVKNGARTRTSEHGAGATVAFVGAWTYDPADEATGVNLRTTVRTAPDGSREVELSEEQGSVVITRDYGNRITARTDQACTWALVARGNVATLDPAVQSCTRSDTTAIILRSWTLSTAGSAQASTMSGTDEHGRTFTLSVGALHKG